MKKINEINHLIIIKINMDPWKYSSIEIHRNVRIFAYRSKVIR